jgi:hypothetical protein
MANNSTFVTLSSRDCDVSIYKKGLLGQTRFVARIDFQQDQFEVRTKWTVKAFIAKSRINKLRIVSTSEGAKFEALMSPEWLSIPSKNNGFLRLLYRNIFVPEIYRKLNTVSARILNPELIPEFVTELKELGFDVEVQI